jgi:phage protein U
MYAQLGNIKFEQSKGFTRYEPTEAARYGEIPLVGGKARLQKTGDELTAITLEVRLHRGFSGTDLDDDVAQIREYMQAGTPLPFTNGAGELIGNFVITSFTPIPETTYQDGRAISLLATITIREWIDPAPELTAARAAQAKGFATNAAKVIPIQITRLGTTADALTSAQVRSTTVNSLSGVADVNAVLTAPSQQESLFARAAAKIAQAQADAEAAIARIEEIATIAAKAPTLLATMGNVYDQIVIFAQRIQDGDLTNALAQATIVTDATGGVGEALLPLDISIILREP